MSDTSQGAGWWQASDGKWYAPELHPDQADDSAPNVAPNDAPVFGGGTGVPGFSAPDGGTVFGTPAAPAGADAPSPSAGADLSFGGPSGDPVFGGPAAAPSDEPAPFATPGLYPTATSAKGPKSKILAGVLGILLGWLGIHRFYLGYYKLGALMAVLTVLSGGKLVGITFLWGLIEGILILIGFVFDKDAYGVELE